MMVRGYERAVVLAEIVRRHGRRERLLEEMHALYPPIGPRVDFHRDRSKRRSLRGANQVGKTKTGALEALYYMTGMHPHRKLPEGPLSGRAVAYSFKQSRKVQETLLEVAPKELVDPACVRGMDPADPATLASVRELGFLHNTFKLRNGATCEVVTAGQSTIALASVDLSWVWCDEPPKPSQYSEIVARLLARNGDLWLTYTPIGRPCGWLKEEVGRGRVSDHVVILSVEHCPFYTQAQIDQVCADYLPAEYGQRVRGDWEGVTTGRVFSGFDERRNLLEELPDADLVLGLGFDHGERSGKEVAVLVGYDTSTSVLYALGEYVSDGATTPTQDAAGVLALLSRYGWSPLDVSIARGDVNSAGKLGGGVKINQLLEEAFRKAVGTKQAPLAIRLPEKGKGSVVAGCRLLNHALLEGRLVVDPSCESLLRSLRHWTGLSDDLKDAADALRYISADFLRADTAPRADRVVING